MEKSIILLIKLNFAFINHISIIIIEYQITQSVSKINFKKSIQWFKDIVFLWTKYHQFLCSC
jgi:hypothetical protein